MKKNNNDEFINMDLESAVKICVERHFKKNQTVMGKNGLINTIKDSIPNYNFYEHYYPFQLHWNVVAACNLRCRHCFHDAYNDKYNSNNDLSTEQAMNLIDELFEMDILRVILTGGEIFLRNDIFEILKKLKSKNIQVLIFTNATLITKEIAENLKSILDPRIDCFQISLDGACKETHEKIRGKNTFDRTVQGINNLVEKGLPIFINYTVMKDNVLEVAQMCELAEALKVKKIFFGDFVPHSKEQEYLLPDIDILFKSMAEVIQLENSKNEAYFRMPFFSFFNLINHKTAKKYILKYINHKEQNNADKNCMCHNHETITLDSNGNIYLCPDAAENDLCCLGNVKNESLIDIWSKRHQNPLFQKRNSSLMVCKACKYFAKGCTGGCVVSAYKKYADILAPDSKCTYVHKLLEKEKSTL